MTQPTTPSLAERLETLKREWHSEEHVSALEHDLYDLAIAQAAELRRLEGELETERATWCKDAQTCTHLYIDDFGHCDGCMVNLSELVALRAENARLREALERVDALTRIDETPPPDHEEGDCIDCGARIDYEAGLEATEPERCNNCHAAWASLRMTDCGNIARAALAQAAGGETKETAR